MLKRIWSDPVWSKVIATLIIAASGAIITQLLGLWPVIYKWLSQPSGWPNWLILAICCLACAGALVLIIAMHASRLKSKAPDWSSYRQDHFYGIKWRWQLTKAGLPSNMAPFCPDCDYQLTTYKPSSFDIIDRIGYYCDCCDKTIQELDQSRPETESIVQRFIQQKLRNNSWQTSEELTH